MGQLLVTGVKWKEINLGCLHGKWCVWVGRFGCWIWGYEGINHTSTCAWNTCGEFVQNLPEMPIRRIKVMERPPPSQLHPHKPFVRNVTKNQDFCFGEIWAHLGFVTFSWRDDSICKSLLKRSQPFHFRNPMVNQTRFHSDSWTKRLIALVNHSLEKKLLQIFHSLPCFCKSHTCACVCVCVCMGCVYRALPIPGNRVCKTC